MTVSSTVASPSSADPAKNSVSSRYSRSLIPGANTTLGAVLTDAQLTKDQANRVAAVAHDGIGRAVRPTHTLYDGDSVFCLATRSVAAPADAVEAAAADVVARAIAAGVRAAQP